jgi:VanZ family protein
MKLSDIMGHAGLSGYAEVALVLFLGVFVAVAVRTFLPGRGAQLDADARLPFDEATPVGRPTPER